MIAGLIQVRKDSSRFPNKAFAPFSDSCLLSFIIRKVKKSKYFTPIVITTDRTVDDDIASLAESENVLYFRGNLNDVAKRAIDCIIKYHISIFARINADCPFFSPELIDTAFEKIIKCNFDLVSNIINRTYPYGISAEVLKSKILINNYSKIQKEEHFKEHFTSFFYENLNKFNYYSLALNENFHNVSLTVDYPTDLEIINNILKEFSDLKEKDYPRLKQFITNIKDI